MAWQLSACGTVFVGLHHRLPRFISVEMCQAVTAKLMLKFLLRAWFQCPSLADSVEKLELRSARHIFRGASTLPQVAIVDPGAI